MDDHSTGLTPGNSLKAGSLHALLEGPALAPPLGVKPDFANPGGSHAMGYGLVICTTLLCTFAVVMRGWSRVLMKTAKVEDALLFIAFGIFVSYQYFAYKFSEYPGLGTHQWNVQFKNLPPILYNAHICALLYGLTMMFLKSAILLDWVHMFVPRGQRNAMFWTSYILIVCNVFFWGADIFARIFQCTPRQKIWNPFFQGGNCPINSDKLSTASAIINLVSDIAILALPQKVIWNLRIDTRTKIGVSLLFTIGTFGCVSAVIRFYYIFVMSSKPADYSFLISKIGLWADFEMTVAFLIIGIPAVPKVIKSLPISKSLLSKLRIWKEPGPTGRVTTAGASGAVGGGARSASHHASWYKSRPVTHQQQLRGSRHSEHGSDETDLVPMTTATPSMREWESEERPPMPNSITKETRLDFTSEPRTDERDRDDFHDWRYNPV